MQKHPLDAAMLPTAVLVRADGAVLYGHGFGRVGEAGGELCFNTAMTGYQEILSDPSYAGQIITFTFPHIGNVGTNPEDDEADTIYAAGMVVQSIVTDPSNWRATDHLARRALKKGLVGIAGIDTRTLTRFLRDKGMCNAIICHNPDGVFDLNALKAKAAALPSLTGANLAQQVTCKTDYTANMQSWHIETGYAPSTSEAKFHVVAIDYGLKKNILCRLVDIGARVTVVPATATYAQIEALQPDGLFLSNGPGDPAAVAPYALPVIREWLRHGKPLFGICMGHQLLALALGGRTEKMKFGHHGANHPVKNVLSGQVEITSMNHGFTVARDSLPTDAEETHYSLFDGSNCGLRLKKRPVFSVQHHPEAAPGPHDSSYLFEQFAAAMQKDAV